ncbi:MAG: glycoside hydrolase family 1 protein [Chloroflexi bacterium]|nr:glycoside hydrolase family 1 protein [Chloroflexota bacterium]
MAKATLYFPPDFKWAAATAAHQVEGNNTNNDWWAWEQTGEHVRGGQESGLACDWWGSGFDRDLDLAARMNHNGHRLSIEWSRIEPQEGRWDSAAIDRYRYMLTGMRERDIEPMVTLHHFTNPLWVAERGGWESPSIVPLFERYAAKAVEALRDLCDLWVTINEPNVYAVLGWSQAADHIVEFTTPSSDFPPGKNDPQLVFKVVDNMLLAHGAAYHAIHRVQPQARVGLAHHMRLFDPARSDSPLDQFCAWNRDRLFNRIPLKAMLDGHLDRPFGLTRRIRQLKSTADFIGLNYYSRDLIQFDRRGWEGMAFGRNIHNPNAEMSDMNYGEIYPRGLFRLLKRLGRYGKPIYITENGLPDLDDDRRPSYLIQTLREVWKAINENVPVMGYYHWTLTDNFEWAEGWNLRFGLVKLHPETQERTLRRSGELYGEMARINAIDDQLVYRYAPELFETLFPG